MVREKGVRGLLEAARSRLLHKKYGTNPSAIHPKAAAYHPHSGHIDAQAVRLYEVAAEQGSSASLQSQFRPCTVVKEC